MKCWKCQDPEMKEDWDKDGEWFFECEDCGTRHYFREEDYLEKAKYWYDK